MLQNKKQYLNQKIGGAEVKKSPQIPENLFKQQATEYKSELKIFTDIIKKLDELSKRENKISKDLDDIQSNLNSIAGYLSTMTDIDHIKDFNVENKNLNKIISDLFFLAYVEFSLVKVEFKSYIIKYQTEQKENIEKMINDLKEHIRNCYDKINICEQTIDQIKIKIEKKEKIKTLEQIKADLLDIEHNNRLLNNDITDAITKLQECTPYDDLKCERNFTNEQVLLESFKSRLYDEISENFERSKSVFSTMDIQYDTDLKTSINTHITRITEGIDNSREKFESYQQNLNTLLKGNVLTKLVEYEILVKKKGSYLDETIEKLFVIVDTLDVNNGSIINKKKIKKLKSVIEEIYTLVYKAGEKIKQCNTEQTTLVQFYEKYYSNVKKKLNFINKIIHKINKISEIFLNLYNLILTIRNNLDNSSSNSTEIINHLRDLRLLSKTEKQSDEIFTGQRTRAFYKEIYETFLKVYDVSLENLTKKAMKDVVKPLLTKEISKRIEEEEEEARRQAEAEEKTKKKAERRARKQAEEEARRKAEEEARRQAEEEERRQAEEEERRQAEEEEERRQAEEEERRQAEEEERRQAEEEARRQAEEEARRRAEEARRQAEEARRQAEEEARRRAEEARRQAEEARRQAEEEKRKA